MVNEQDTNMNKKSIIKIAICVCSIVIVLYSICNIDFILGIVNPKYKEAKELLQQIGSITVYATDEYDGNPYQTYTESSKDGKLYVYRHKIETVTLDRSMVSKLIPKAKYSTDFVLWKGSHAGIAKLKNGKEIKLYISYYGGFFRVHGMDGYYYFDGSARYEWDNTVEKFHENKPELIDIQEDTSSHSQP